LRADGVELAAKPSGFFAAGGRIENHTGWHTRMICGERTVSRGEIEAFACAWCAIPRNLQA
jgi:hypothetical protein